MNCEYIRMLTYSDVMQFISKALTAHCKTNLVFKPSYVKTDAVSQQVEFEAMVSNGIYLTGKAICRDFDCDITLNDEKQTKLTYTKEWADWVYSVIKAREVGLNARKCEFYRADYNDHRKAIRDAKCEDVDQEFETSLLR